MKTMRIVLVVMSAVLLLSSPSSAGAASGNGWWHPDAHASDICKSDWMKSLGDVPCETSKDAALLRCEPGARPYYEWRNRFRFYVDGAWSPWWVYAHTYTPAPVKACLP